MAFWTVWRNGAVKVPTLVATRASPSLSGAVRSDASGCPVGLQRGRQERRSPNSAFACPTAWCAAPAATARQVSLPDRPPVKRMHGALDHPRADHQGPGDIARGPAARPSRARWARRSRPWRASAAAGVGLTVAGHGHQPPASGRPGRRTLVSGASPASPRALPRATEKPPSSSTRPRSLASAPVQILPRQPFLVHRLVGHAASLEPWPVKSL